MFDATAQPRRFQRPELRGPARGRRGALAVTFGFFATLAAASVAASGACFAFSTLPRLGRPIGRLFPSRRYAESSQAGQMARGSLAKNCPQDASTVKVSGLSPHDQWRHMLANKQQWTDLREAKSIGMVPIQVPDFLHMDSGTKLQLDHQTPGWVTKNLIDGNFAPQAAQMWAEVIHFPDQWSDYRESKANGWVKDTYPDFVHVSGQHRSVWLNERDIEKMPNLMSELEKLEDKFAPVAKGMGILAHMRNFSLYWSDYREAKQKGWVGNDHPDYVHRRSDLGVWIDKTGLEERWKSMTKNLMFSPPCRGKAAIHHMLEHPSEWVDQRASKEESSNAADFRHVKTDALVWLRKMPEELMEQLKGVTFARVDSKYETNPGLSNVERAFQDLIHNRVSWWDFRTAKQAGTLSARHPDFTNVETKFNLWLDGPKTPAWAREQLEKEDFQRVPANIDEVMETLGLSER